MQLGKGSFKCSLGKVVSSAACSKIGSSAATHTSTKGASALKHMCRQQGYRFSYKQQCDCHVFLSMYLLPGTCICAGTVTGVRYVQVRVQVYDMCRYGYRCTIGAGMGTGVRQVQVWVQVYDRCRYGYRCTIGAGMGTGIDRNLYYYVYIFCLWSYCQAF